MFKNRMILGLIFVVSLGLGLGSAWATMNKKPAMSERQVASSEQKGTGLGHREKIQAGVKAKVTEQKGTQTVVEVKPTEPKFVMEYKFDEPIIDVIFGEATMTVKEARALGVKGLEKRKDTERVKVDYPKVKFVLDPGYIDFRKEDQDLKELKFYDKNGNIKKRVDVAGCIVATSHNKKFITVGKEPTEWEPDLKGGRLYRCDGTEVWKKDKGPIPTTVSNEGYVIAEDLDWDAIIPPSKFTFYDPRGNEVGNVKNIYPSITGYASFSKSGEYALVVFSSLSKAVMILTTKEGKILWERKIDRGCWSPSRVNFVEGVGIVCDCAIYDQKSASYKDKVVYFIDWNGNIRWMIPVDELSGERIIRFSEDYKRVFIATHQGFLWCIDIQTGKVLWRHEEDWARQAYKIIFNLPSFFEMEIKENIYVVGKYRDEEIGWHSSRLYIFNSENGNLLQKIEYPNRKITLTTQDNKIFVIDIDTKKVSLIETLKRGK